MEKNKFENLEAWKEAHKLVIMVYEITKNFPPDEKYRLVDQLCRSSSSVAANLVEGNSRGHRKEFIQYEYQSRGSLEETKYHLLLAKDLSLLKSDEYNGLQDQANKTGKLINGLITFLKNN
jgi:four helix bundle protein